MLNATMDSQPDARKRQPGAADFGAPADHGIPPARTLPAREYVSLAEHTRVLDLQTSRGYHGKRLRSFRLHQGVPFNFQVARGKAKIIESFMSLYSNIRSGKPIVNFNQLKSPNRYRIPPMILNISLANMMSLNCF